MKFFKLSTLAFAVSLSFSTILPAEANVFNLLVQKKQHHIHRQHHQPHHRHHEAHSNRSVYYRNRNYHRSSNYHNRYNVPRRRVFNHSKNYGNWHGRY